MWLCFILLGVGFISAELPQTFNCGTVQNLTNYCFNETSPDVLDFIETIKVDFSEEDLMNQCE